MVGFKWSETVTMELSSRIKRSGVNNLNENCTASKTRRLALRIDSGGWITIFDVAKKEMKEKKREREIKELLKVEERD